MARRLEASFEYSDWFSTYDWVRIGGRSITAYGSPDDHDEGSQYRWDEIRYAWSPGTGTVRSSLNHIALQRFRALLGYRALILSARLAFYRSNQNSANVKMELFELLTHPDLDDCNMVYYDQSESLKWYLDGYAPQWGFDVGAVPAAIAYADLSKVPALDVEFELRDLFQRLLRSGNDDLWFHIIQRQTATEVYLKHSAATKRPVLTVDYIYPFEIYPCKADGTIDLSSLLTLDTSLIDLGVYERGEVGAGIPFMVKSFHDQTHPHLELWDDSPEWPPPAADSGNGGTGALAYVQLIDLAVSQKYEVKFSNATDFEVKAVAYLDNVESLHPQYDADPNWEGTTAGDWTAPSGGLTIPAAAWSGTPNANDVFVVFVRGNTTLGTWPSDANRQVEMCGDAGGTPDGDWRPIRGQRTVSTGAVTIDAATKTIDVKRIVTSEWPVGTPAFIANADTIDEGTIQGVTATSVTIEGLAITSNIYAAGAIVATTLPIRSLAASPWAQLSDESGASQAQANRLYIEDADQLDFVADETIYVQSLETPGLSEEGVIQQITSSYLQLYANLENTYEAGAWIVQAGSGERKVWLRVAADETSDYERKPFRMNLIS